MSNQNKPAVLSATDRARTGVTNIGDAVEQELGYVKSILHAISVLADQDARRNKLEIESLAKCAHWIADNLEGSIDHFGGEILRAVDEVKNA